MSTNVNKKSQLSTKRKFTLGFSYLRSAIADVALVQPNTFLISAFHQFANTCEIYSFGNCPKCYNISIKNKNK